MLKANEGGETPTMINVLICDESMSDAEDLVTILDYSYGTAMRTRVFYKSSGVLSYIRGAPVDICFLELVMQEMSGIELAKALRANGYNGEIVFISRDKTFGPESFEVNALDYLQKPVMPEDVRNAVDKLLRRNP